MADAARQASYLTVELPRAAGSPRGGHLPVREPPWPGEEPELEYSEIYGPVSEEEHEAANAKLRAEYPTTTTK